jgi:hypothetical protein
VFENAFFGGQTAKRDKQTGKIIFQTGFNVHVICGDITQFFTDTKEGGDFLPSG